MSADRRRVLLNRLAREGLLFALLLAAFVLPRIFGLGSFVTADEPTWAKRSAIFYYALANREFPATYQTGHPGVTTMWAGALAYYLKFPEYARYGQLDLGDTKLFQIFQRHGPAPILVMATARSVMVLLNTAAFLIAFYLARAIFGTAPALVGFLLIAFDPFYVAHSRVLHTNGLVSILILLSLLGYLYFLHEHKWRGLLISAVAAGLSILTVTPGFLLFPSIGLLALIAAIYYWRGDHPTGWRWLVSRVILPLVVWGLVSLFVVYIFWPAMWQNPIGIFQKITTYSLSAAEGDIGGTRLLGAFQDQVEASGSYWYYYPFTYLWRSTPFTLIGLGLLALGLVWRKSEIIPKKFNRDIFSILAFILLFSVVMSLGEKKHDRYYLPVYLPLDLLAGLGWYGLSQFLVRRYAALRRIYFSYILLGGMLILQLALTVSSYPYYLTYYNPLLGGIRKAQEVMTVGWGEGLNEAARYLKDQPDISKKIIYSWYPLVFNWYSANLGFQAQVTDIEGQPSPERMQDYLTADYLVVYVNEWQRNTPPELFVELAKHAPVHTIIVDGVEYARIYRPSEWAGSQ